MRTGGLGFGTDFLTKRLTSARMYSDGSPTWKHSLTRTPNGLPVTAEDCGPRASFTTHHRMPTNELFAGLSNSAPTLAVVLVAFMGGGMVPFPYAMGRFRGFGRVMLSKLTYAAPPGQEKQTALEAATNEDIDDTTAGAGQGGGE